MHSPAFRAKVAAAAVAIATGTAAAQSVDSARVSEDAAQRARRQGLPALSPIGLSVVGTELGGRLDSDDARQRFAAYANRVPPQFDDLPDKGKVDELRARLAKASNEARNAIAIPRLGDDWAKQLGDGLLEQRRVAQALRPLDSARDLLTETVRTLSADEQERFRRLATQAAANATDEIATGIARLVRNSTMFKAGGALSALALPDQEAAALLIASTAPAVLGVLGEKLERRATVAVMKAAQVSAAADIVKRFSEKARSEYGKALEVAGAQAQNAKTLLAANAELATTYKTYVQRATASAASGANGSLVRQQLSDIERVLGGAMTPRQQLEALKSPAFLPGLSLADREKLVRNARQVVDVTERHDKFVSGLSTAGEFVQLAALVGLPIDMHKVNQGLNFASNVSTAYLSFWTGNYMGAFQGVSGALGAFRKKGDASQEQFKAIMKALGEIMALQRQTLQAVADLSKQVEEATRKTLDGQRYTYLAIEDGDYGRDVVKCAQLLKGAATAGAIDGIFPSYEDRRAFANNATNKERLSRCHVAIRDLGDPRTAVSYNYAAPYLLAVDGRKSPALPESAALDVDDSALGDYRTYEYAPFHRLTRWILDAAAKRQGGDLCYDALLRRFAEVPLTVQGAQSLQQLPTPCPPGTDFKGLPAFDGKRISYNSALHYPLNARRLLLLGSSTLLLAPFREFMVNPLDPLSGLVSQSDLLRDGAKRGEAIGAASQLAAGQAQAWLDLIHIALAQETMLSGAPILQETVASLRAAKFGFADSEAVKRKDALAAWQSDRKRPAPASFALAKPRGEKLLLVDKSTPSKLSVKGCAVTRDSFELELGHPLILCMLQHRPEFMQNVATVYVREVVTTYPPNKDFSPEQAFQAYEMARTQRTEQLRDYFKGESVPLKFDESSSQWVMQWLAPGGETLNVPLPTADSLQAGGRLVYPEYLPSLLRLARRLRDLETAARVQPSAMSWERQAFTTSSSLLRVSTDVAERP